MIVVEAIPYKNLKQRIKIIKDRMDKGFRVEITPKYIYTEKYIQDKKEGIE